MITTPATVVLVPPDAGHVEHSAELDWAIPPPGGRPDPAIAAEAGVTCETTLHENGRPTLCDCGQVLYKVDLAMKDPRWDEETVG